MTVVNKGPLVALGEALGYGEDTWSEQESWTDLSTPEGPWTAACLKVARQALWETCEAYGKALELSLVVAPGIAGVYPQDAWRWEASSADSATRLETFLAQFKAPTKDEVHVYWTLDKTTLAKRALTDLGAATGGTPANSAGPSAAADATVMLFPAALSRLFTHLATLKELEKIWRGGEEQEWVVLVPDWRAECPPADRVLAGPYLTLLGGDVADVLALVQARPRSAPTAAEVVRSRARHLRWDERWFEVLTPLHLDLRGNVPADDPVVAPLRWQLANLAVLYTADSAHRPDPPGGGEGEAGGWQVTFAGADRRLTMDLRPAPEVLTPRDLAGVEAWGDLVDWVYADERSTSDRLAVVQNVVCREAWQADRGEAFARLLPRIPAVLDQAKHSWRAFIEGKVDAFFSQAQSLEEHVAGAVQTFGEQTSALLKRLTETMLAAVAVVIAALVLPAARSGEVDLRVLWWGILVYAVYVLLFPVSFGLSAQWQEHRALEQGFEERYQRFRRQLPTYWIEAVGREPVDRGLRRYRTWFWLTVVAYLALLAALALALLVIGVRLLL